MMTIVTWPAQRGRVRSRAWRRFQPRVSVSRASRWPARLLGLLAGASTVATAVFLVVRRPWSRQGEPAAPAAGRAAPTAREGHRQRRMWLRQFNKRFLNPAMLRLAGRRHWYASALHHTGRHSGRAYITPVVAEPVTDGFIIPLPYGVDTDWCRNVQAAGGCAIVREGVSCQVVAPEVLDRAAVAPLLPAATRIAWRLYGIKHFLRVRLAPSAALAEPEAAESPAAAGVEA